MWRCNWSLRVLLVTFVTLSALAAVTSSYLGPRYGKRLPSGSNSGEVSRIVGRSSGPRTIQSRSQARFYAGSRYGGKRSYWPSIITPPEGEMSGDSLQPPFDCVYVPYLGVRCALPRTEEWGHGDPDSSADSEDGPRDLYPAPSLTRTSIIDGTPEPSGSQ